MTTLIRPLVCAALMLLLACGGLPRDFDERTLDGKIQAYSRHLSRGGKPLLHARRGIAAHRGAAAARLVKIAAGRDESRLPRAEALNILKYIQIYHCSLDSIEVRRLVDALLRDPALFHNDRAAAFWLREAVNASSGRRRCDPARL